MFGAPTFFNSCCICLQINSTLRFTNIPILYSRTGYALYSHKLKTRRANKNLGFRVMCEKCKFPLLSFSSQLTHLHHRSGFECKCENIIPPGVSRIIMSRTFEYANNYHRVIFYYNVNLLGEDTSVNSYAELITWKDTHCTIPGAFGWLKSLTAKSR